MSDTQSGPFSLGQVLEEELKEIKNVRDKRASGNQTYYGIRREPTPAPPAPIAVGASESKPKWQTQDVEWVSRIANAHNNNLVGLAFSGGGIRSATFNLGVLQALADLKLLFRIDYLSTVSGGGYIGGWLAAWTKRLGNFAEVQKRLSHYRVHKDDDNEPKEIRFLRVFSDYLTPRLGIFSGDTLAAVAIILRNILLNQIVLLAGLATVLLLPRLAICWGNAVQAWMRGHGRGALGIFLLLLTVAFLVITNNMTGLDRSGKRWLLRRVFRRVKKLRLQGVFRKVIRLPLRLTGQKQILWLAALPLFVGAMLAALRRWPKFDAWSGAELYWVIWLLATVVVWLLSWLGRKKQGDEKGSAKAAPDWSLGLLPVGVLNIAVMVFSPLIAGAVGGWLYHAMVENTKCYGMKEDLMFGVPLVVGIFLLTITLHIGLMGIAFNDWRREWWGRLGGWLLLWGGLWLALFWVALCFPCFIDTNAQVKALAAKYLTPAGIVGLVTGLLAAKGDATGKPGELKWKDYFVKAAPYVFAVGLVCWMSWGIEWLRKSWAGHHKKAMSEAGAMKVRDSLDQLNGFLASIKAAADQVVGFGAKHPLGAVIVGCVVVAVVMAWRVDINQFSMHLLYRNRLVRCYLGASHFRQEVGEKVSGEDRSPNRFTGFDPDDDVWLKDLRAEAKEKYDGPYPIMNAALNLVKGKDLAWQERKAESFVMTPLYCGYDVWLEDQDSPLARGERPVPEKRKANQAAEEATKGKLERFGYRPTPEFAFPSSQGGYGLFLGTAMGISGAAASPNMGFYTSAPVAFLMTLFNVRLGQWLGNPRHKKAWKRATPRFSLKCLLNELFAGTTDDAAYVYLSDGGHFDNMGLYELVKRRCGLIILCDAEADPDYEFGGLANAIRKCRTDMGIDIDLDVSDIKPPADGPSKSHCAVGEVHYEYADCEAPTGTIIYVKASLTGDEPVDLQNYKQKHGAFPHESTVDQWFTESQFESYRKLGYYEILSLLERRWWELHRTLGAFGFDTSALPGAD